MTQTRSVLVGDRDHARLLSLIKKSDPQTVTLLYDELDAATVLPEAEVPPDVVAMESTVTFRDTDTGQESTVELVYPARADASQGRISILAPVGAALIGLRVGGYLASKAGTGIWKLSVSVASDPAVRHERTRQNCQRNHQRRGPADHGNAQDGGGRGVAALLGGVVTRRY